MATWPLGLLSASIVVLAPRAATSQAIGGLGARWSIGAAAGGVVPSGRFGDHVDRGIAGAVFVEHRFGGADPALDARARLRVEATYADLAVSDASLARFGASDGHAGLAALTANLVVTLQQVALIRPYVAGGAGAYRRSIRLDGAVASVPVEVLDEYGALVGEERGVLVADAAYRRYTQVRPGLNAGAGLESLLGRVHAFVEARHHVAFTRRARTSVTPIVFGIRY